MPAEDLEQKRGAVQLYNRIIKLADSEHDMLSADPQMGEDIKW